MKKLRHTPVELLVALGVLFVTSPFVQNLPYGTLIEGLLVTVVMVLGMLAVSDQRQHFVITVILLALALAAKWIHHFRPDLVHPTVPLAGIVVFYGFVVAQLLRFIVRAPRVDLNVLCAGISGFLMLGLLWMPLYLLVAQLDPGAFNLPGGASGTLDGFSAFFFSFVTLCTVGYGDITPVSKVARMLAVMEAITGLFYMAVLISRLVSVYSAASRDARADGQKE